MLTSKPDLDIQLQTKCSPKSPTIFECRDPFSIFICSSISFSLPRLSGRAAKDRTDAQASTTRFAEQPHQMTAGAWPKTRRGVTCAGRRAIALANRPAQRFDDGM